MEVKGLILCGGKSTRMEKDKVEVIYKGQPLLSYPVQLFEALGIDFYLSINNSQNHLTDQLNCIQDIYTNKGPLGGILSALEVLKTDLIVLPIDMPSINPTMLKKLLTNWQGQNKVCCFQNQDKIQPFPSIWSQKTKATLNEFVNAHQLSVQSFITQVPHQLISTHQDGWFKNVNTLNDL